MDTHTLPADVAEILDPWMIKTADTCPYNLPGAARVYSSTTAARVDVTASGSHYFDRDALRFFNARTHGAIIGRRFFLESIRCDWHDGTDAPDPRQYRVSWVSGDGAARLSVEHSRDFDSLEAARAAAEILAEHYGD